MKVLSDRSVADPIDSLPTQNMVITDKFVYIHMGKTGGTFVEKVLSRLHSDNNGFYLDTSTAAGRRLLGSVDQHESVREIPAEHRNKKICFTIRNPFEHYVSRYEFAWWKIEPRAIFDGDTMKTIFPTYPDLSFRDYMEALNNWDLRTLRPRASRPYNPELFMNVNIGNLTWLFIQFVFHDPLRVIKNLDHFIRAGKNCEELQRFHFIDTMRLNHELHDFLLEMGYEGSQIAFILDLGRIYPPEGGRSEGHKWEDYYTPDMMRQVREKDRFIFSLFPHFDR